MTTKNALSPADRVPSDNPQEEAQSQGSTAPKGRPTPKRATAKPKSAGAKPKFVVVEHALKCQTSEGEVSLDLRLPLAAFEKLSALEGMSENESLPFIRNEIMPADVSGPIMALRDGVESMDLIMKWIEAVGERFGASLGKLDGSSAS
ncbi:hypothetical protein SAMN04489740_1002 [Arthrobacter alpinus]|uniref:Tail assembly chaperone n=1 Tax=Arthrobacter alpinus TaxID=656366 RepID=A0A1H5HGB0_9MICC|nr:hypothetical protein [Arthrobacter alpinus]SEE26681.1 hypothetical protein SAMN04489740_1002 [Arthrobacter alpinus]